MDLRVFLLHNYTAMPRDTSWVRAAQDYTCQGAGLGIVSLEAFGSTDAECCAERKCEVGKNTGRSQTKHEKDEKAVGLCWKPGDSVSQV